MCGIACAEFPAPPPEALALGRGLFDSAAWWDTVAAHGLPPGAEAVFLVARSGERVVAMAPMVRSGGRLAGLTTPYTCVYRPLIDDGIGAPARIAAMAAIARRGRRAGVVRLDAIPAEWAGLAALEAGCRQAGMVPLRFDHFGNWYEEVDGLDWAAYLVRRPGALRETIRRRLRRAEGLAGARFALFTRMDDGAAEAYEAVYRRSWKEAEPFPSFNVALMRAVGEMGVLRLGIWSIGTVPVAAQFWVVTDGRATVLKLAHDEAFKAHSPGTVLTALMLRHLLDAEAVTEIDFGRGDDLYKQGWAGRRRQRIGVLMVDPWSLRGGLVLARHLVGRLWRR